MKDYSTQGGTWKECPQCGKKFFCTSPEWVYKRPVSVDGKSSMWFFDKYSCMRVFDEKQKAKRRSENAKLQHKRQKQEAAGRRRADGEA